LGKTEGNGLVNDFTRGYASVALSLLFQRFMPPDQAAKICLVMSGGTEGGMAPHWTIFERSESNGAKGPALAFGRAHTRHCRPSISVVLRRSRWLHLPCAQR
jgi:cyanuric acid amidohydrolase